MAYPTPRSMNANLEEGMSDGKYKKVVMNRGGVCESARLYDDRKDLADVWHGIHECPVKVFPDGSSPRRTPNTVDTNPVECNCP
jgi:hypothetical protein